MISAAEIGEPDRREAAEGRAVTITDTLRAAARHVEERKATVAWEGPDTRSDGDRARNVAAVSALGHELDGLATASETSRVYPREFEAVRCELQARGFVLPPEIARAIADAFLADAVARALTPRFRNASRS